MATRNDITGDTIRSKASNENYRNNWDLIFKKEKVAHDEPTQVNVETDTDTMGDSE